MIAPPAHEGGEERSSATQRSSITPSPTHSRTSRKPTSSGTTPATPRTRRGTGDLWLLYAAAANQTKTVRFGPNLSGVYLREPTLICQALATLDELTGGRAEGVISCGNFGLLAQYGVDWTKIKPFTMVKEAHHAMRTFLDEGTITYEGEIFKYSGLFTFARPVQEHLLLYVGAMRGPKSMQLAGEVSDGVHSALGYNKAWYAYVVENVKIGAERAGRDWNTLDIGAWCVITCGPTRRRRRPQRARSWPSTSPRCRTSSSRCTASTPRR